jgi:hypothetical protein
MTRRLLATAVALAALAGCTNDATPSPAASGAPSATATTEPSGSATPSATATASPTATVRPPGGTMTVPVYYLGGGNASSGASRPVLYREFRTVPKSDGVVRAAVEAMLHMRPLDPDYRSLWPTATQIRGVSISGTVATVDVTNNARTANAGATVEEVSLQQLVYTVTAAAPSVRSVRLRFDGQTKETLWGHIDTKRPITRLESTEVVAPIWVIDPGQRARVSRTFTVKGTATVFEANVQWSVTRPGSSTPIRSGFVTATKGAPERGDFTVTVTLPAGTTGDVVFTAWESSAQDGRVLFPDSKTYGVA